MARLRVWPNITAIVLGLQQPTLTIFVFICKTQMMVSYLVFSFHVIILCHMRAMRLFISFHAFVFLRLNSFSQEILRKTQTRFHSYIHISASHLFKHYPVQPSSVPRLRLKSGLVLVVKVVVPSVKVILFLFGFFFSRFVEQSVECMFS